MSEATTMEFKMKRFFLVATFFLSTIFTLSAETIFMKVGSRTFELEVKETVCGKEFLRFVKDKDLKMQKYGGFEFYVYENLKTSNESADSRYEKGNVYYNTTYNAISFAYEDHNLSSREAVLIGTFKDRSVSDFLKNAAADTSFLFSSKECGRKWRLL